MKKLLLILICLFVSTEVKSVSPTKHQWTFYGKDKDGYIDFYVDYKNVETRNGFVYWYELSNWENEPMGGKSRIMYNKGDCGDMKEMSLTTFVYNKLNGLGDMMRSYPPSERHSGWRFLVPGSNGELKLKKVCEVSSEKR